MAVAKAKGRLRATAQAQAPPGSLRVDLWNTGTHTTAELAELFSVGRSTVYRAIRRGGGHVTTSAKWRCKNPAR